MQPNAPKLSTSPFILKWVFPALYLGALGEVDDARSVAGEIADSGVDLGDCDLE